MNIFGYFIVEFVAVSLGDGGGNVIYKFCMLVMIKKNEFRKVYGRWGGADVGDTDKNTYKNIKKQRQ